MSKLRECLSYDDVQIIPKYSETKHRESCDTLTRFTKNTTLTIPIVSSPMDTITEFEMAWALAHLGGIGFIHRFMDIEKQVDQTASLGAMTAGAAIGVTGDYFERAQELVNNGCNVLFICLLYTSDAADE